MTTYIEIKISSTISFESTSLFVIVLKKKDFFFVFLEMILWKLTLTKNNNLKLISYKLKG